MISNKFKKFGITLGIFSLILLGACTDSEIKNETNETVLTAGEEVYSELNMLRDMVNLGGEGIVLQAVLGQSLLKTYEVSEEELSDLKEMYYKELGGKENFEEYISNINLSEEELDEQFRIEVAQLKALREMNEVTDDKVKEVYEDIKVAVEGSYFITFDKDLAEDIKTKLENGEEVDKLNENLSEQEKITSDLFIKSKVEEELKPLFELEEGSVFELELDGLYHIIRYEDEITRTYEELKDSIEMDLLYEGIESQVDILSFVLSKGKVEFHGEYKELIDRLISDPVE